METGIILDQEMLRMQKLPNTKVDVKNALEPLAEMSTQIHEIKCLVETNRDLLGKKGANTKVLAELERWLSIAQVIPKHVEFTIQRMNAKISNTK